jgi:hypothetical protein
MREAQDGFAGMKDVDAQTFVRFCEYIYIGDYTTVQYEVMLDSFVTAAQNLLFRIMYEVPQPI